eukprot:TRINITY_DN13675_c0_g1_i3.p1 TRINITY_DN13675_c0_g1~~TRINITY_DN13675_c0_g1_i3.p1  ORF type:complete len:206 (-),score=21.20 TRINITY_DN13675_c0_g1_i3:622-1239(-)
MLPDAIGLPTTCTSDDDGVTYGKVTCSSGKLTYHLFLDSECARPVTDGGGNAVTSSRTTCRGGYMTKCQTSAPRITFTVHYYSDSSCETARQNQQNQTSMQIGVDNLIGCLDRSDVNGRKSELHEKKGGKWWRYKYVGVSDCSGTPEESTNVTCGSCEEKGDGEYERAPGLCGSLASSAPSSARLPAAIVFAALSTSLMQVRDSR